MRGAVTYRKQDHSKHNEMFQNKPSATKHLAYKVFLLVNLIFDKNVSLGDGPVHLVTQYKQLILHSVLH